MRRSRTRSVHNAGPVFAALGDGVRLRVVDRLSAEGPLPITRLAEGSGVSRQALAKHLRVLQEAGLVQGERVGRENVFELKPRRLERARRHLDAIGAQWDQTLNRLKAFVEADQS